MLTLCCGQLRTTRLYCGHVLLVRSRQLLVSRLKETTVKNRFQTNPKATIYIAFESGKWPAGKRRILLIHN